MSDYEHSKGKLTPVEIVGDLENTAKLLLEKMEIEPVGWYDNFLEQFEVETYRTYIVLNDKIYKIESTPIDIYDDILNAVENEDETIDFEVKFYNGGCSFSEAIEIAVKRALTEKRDE